VRINPIYSLILIVAIGCGNSKPLYNKYEYLVYFRYINKSPMGFSNFYFRRYNYLLVKVPEAPNVQSFKRKIRNVTKANSGNDTAIIFLPSKVPHVGKRYLRFDTLIKKKVAIGREYLDSIEQKEAYSYPKLLYTGRDSTFSIGKHSYQCSEYVGRSNLGGQYFVSYLYSEQETRIPICIVERAFNSISGKLTQTRVDLLYDIYKASFR
jgi:hypothetical protein